MHIDNATVVQMRNRFKQFLFQQKKTKKNIYFQQDGVPLHSGTIITYRKHFPDDGLI